MADISSDVPEALQKSKESKSLAAEAAQEQLDAEIPHSERVIVALGYVSFLCILPLVLLQHSRFAQFHGKQALVLAIFIYFLDHLEILPAAFSGTYNALKLLLVLYAIYKSLKGEYFRIPFLYNLSERFQIQITEKDPKAQQEPL